MNHPESEAKDALRKAAAIIQSLERRLQAADAARSEPVAIVGAGCRLPGGANSVAALGELLRAGTDTVGPIPPSRFDVDAAYDPDPSAPGKMYARHGAFLDSVDGFDPAFFGMSPREAAWLDPQHRIVLECAWEALEDAGAPPDRLRNTHVGVYVGIGPCDYEKRIFVHAAESLEAYAATGTGTCFSAGRLSFLLGLHGPSVAIDTACSSSLVALHLACQAVRAGECELALAGGVLVMLSPEPFILLSRLRALAPDGRCKTFSDHADGYGRGEGCGIVVLKKLSAAQRDGDRVLAVIRGSAINHDGPSGGLTRPNGSAQRDVIRQALTVAGVAPADVDYVEAHGTGTALGDPVELEALAAIYGKGRTEPLRVGTVKSNLGHLEWASGIAGVLKVLAALRDDAIPPSLHAEDLNPLVDWEALPVRVVRSIESWPAGGKPRRAGVSSFGMSGTNAHVILEEAPAIAPRPSAPATRPIELAVLSARTPSALATAAGRLRDHLAGHPEVGLGDLAFSLATTRPHHAHRLALAVPSREALTAALETAAAGETPVVAVRGEVRARRGKLASLFTGQGAQRLGMGRGLHDAWPAFRDAWDRCAALFDKVLPRPLRDVVWAAPGATDLDRTLYTQPALFTLEYALAALWRSWGVEPDLLVGHSIGELVAACVAGVFSLEDAVKLCAARARLMQALPAGGVMVAVAGPLAEIGPAVAAEASVSLAATNGPDSVVLSGDEEKVLALAAGFAARGMRTTRLKVSHAFHSPLMEPMLEDFRRVAATIAYRAPERTILSNLTGAVAGPEIATADYWVRHVRGTVRFAESVAALAAAGATTYVEVGPKPTLLSLVSTGLGGTDAALVPSLRADRAEPEAILVALGNLYARGGAVDWTGVFPADVRRVELPTYPWERERHWVDLAPTRAAQAGGRWPLSGVLLPTSGDVWHHVLAIAPNRPSFVADHVVWGKVVVAGAFHVSAILAVAAEHWPDRALELVGLEFVRARAFEPGEEIELHIVLTPEGDEELRRFEVMSAADGRFITHVRGRVGPTDAQPGTLPGPRALESRAIQPVDKKDVFDRLSAMRIDWGPKWRWVEDAHLGPDASLATLAPTYPGAHDVAPIHPSLLDNAFAVSLLGSLLSAGDGTPRLPFAVDRLRFWRAPVGKVRCAGVPQPRVADLSSFVLTCEDVGVVAEVEGMSCRGAPLERFLPGATAAERDAALAEGSTPPVGDELLELSWEGAAVPAPAVMAGRWLLVDDGGGLAEPLRAALEKAGQRVARASAIEDIGATFGGVGPTAIVHLGSLGAGGGIDAATVEEALVRGCDSVLATVKALAALASPEVPRLWLVTRGAQAVGGAEVAVAQAPLLGLARVIAREHAELRCARVDLDPARPPGEVADLTAELLGDDGEEEIAWRAGERRVARLAQRPFAEAPAERSEPAGARPYRLEMDEPGVLDRLVLRVAERHGLVQTALGDGALGAGDVEIAVEAAGLNFLAVLLAMGVMPDEAPGALGAPLAPGGECAGRIVRVGAGVTDLVPGQAVVALALRGAFASHVTMPETLVMPAPEGLSMAQAAALPVAYLTAWYSLERVARLRRGERVLIHSATGGVGLAAVQWAQHVGAEVYATAGSPEKRAYLKSLGVEYVSDSRSNRFVSDVRDWTHGEGVDVVLNSLSGELIGESFKLLRPYGRFVELGKRDYYADHKLGLRPFLKNLSFTLVDVRGMMIERPDWVRELFKEVLALVAAGVLTPPPVTTVPMGQIVDGFRAMARGQHMGKLVATLDDPDIQVQVRAAREAHIRADGTYLVTGGLGGLGLSVAGWLADRGAGHLVLLGRSGATSDAQRSAIAALQERGARVTVAQADVADRDALARVLAEVGPLRGVVHAAGLLDDGLLLQQTPARLRAVMAPKVQGALNLHDLTREDPLDFFVFYAAGAGLLGAPGQGNYAAANTFLDALAHHRRAHGLPALSIDWGPFSDVGMAAAQDNRAARLLSRGISSLSPADGLRVLERLLGTDQIQVGVVPLDVPQWVESYPAAAESRRFGPILAAHRTAPVGERAVRAGLMAMAPEEREESVRGIVRAQAARVLRVAENKLDAEAQFTSLGMDSLLGLELRNRLGAELGLQLPATLIFQYPTVAEVTEYVVDALLRAALTFEAGSRTARVESAGDAPADLEEEGTI